MSWSFPVILSVAGVSAGVVLYTASQAPEFGAMQSQKESVLKTACAEIGGYTRLTLPNKNGHTDLVCRWEIPSKGRQSNLIYDFGAYEVVDGRMTTKAGFLSYGDKPTVESGVVYLQACVNLGGALVANSSTDSYCNVGGDILPYIFIDEAFK